MSLNLSGWHARYLQQARWTYNLRQYAYQGHNLQKAQDILEVGCGTGALLAELARLSRARITGLDIDRERLSMAQRHAPGARLVEGDAHRLPFSNAHYDLSLCHFLLLWVDDPLQVISEMKRVTRPGGSVLALAEPDYGGRVDYPPEIARLGEMQRESLRSQGADPEMGRRLASLFKRAGLAGVETGVLGGEWKEARSMDEWKTEWEVMESDLAGRLSPRELDDLKRRDLQATLAGERILFVPVFYAFGIVPDLQPKSQ